MVQKSYTGFAYILLKWFLQRICEFLANVSSGRNLFIFWVAWVYTKIHARSILPYTYTVHTLWFMVYSHPSWFVTSPTKRWAQIFYPVFPPIVANDVALPRVIVVAGNCKNRICHGKVIKKFPRFLELGFGCRICQVSRDYNRYFLKRVCDSAEDHFGARDFFFPKANV